MFPLFITPQMVGPLTKLTSNGTSPLDSAAPLVEQVQCKRNKIKFYRI